MEPIHIVARTVGGSPMLENLEARMWLWRELRRSMPPPVAGVLMPNHLHLVYLKAPSIAHELKVMSLLLRKCSLRYGKHELGWRVAKPMLIPDSKHLLRTIKYVHLNPCRDKLVNHPLRWTCSTFRDDMGLTLSSWSSLKSGLNRIGTTHQRYLDYVMTDSTVEDDIVLNSPVVQSQNGRDYTLQHLLKTVEEAGLNPIPKNGNLNTRHKKLFFKLATQVGWTNMAEIGRLVGVSRQSVRKSLLSKEVMAMQSKTRLVTIAQFFRQLSP